MEKTDEPWPLAVEERLSESSGEVATSEAALVGLGAEAYDGVVCTMALMDMPVIAPLYRAVAQLLRPGGRFVFATAHPAFNSNNPVVLAEQADEDGVLTTRHALRISGYLELPPTRMVGARDEPRPHLYYHRPLHALLEPAFAAGLCLEALEEPAFPREEAEEARPLSWMKLWQIPPVLAGRLRLRPSGQWPANGGSRDGADATDDRGG